MFSLFANEKQMCPEIEREVSLNQRQTECRRQNDCVQEVCPLQYDFLSESIDFQVATARFRNSV